MSILVRLFKVLTNRRENMVSGLLRLKRNEHIKVGKSIGNAAFQFRM